MVIRSCLWLFPQKLSATIVSRQSSEPSHQLESQTPRPAATEVRPAKRPARSARERLRTVEEYESYPALAPREVSATLLDEGEHLCHWSTMYRLLRQVDERRRRRDHPRANGYRKLELLARQPNQLWSWDITKLKGPATRTYFYLYVIIDVFSRYVVGWMLATCESAELAEALIAETCARERIEPGQLTVHAGRGSAMRSTEVAQLEVLP